VSKTPFSGELTYFEMKVMKVNQKAHLGIGLCHSKYKTNEMLGWRQGSMGYHADNGGLV
jgi:hypothetical protein